LGNILFVTNVGQGVQTDSIHRFSVIAIDDKWRLIHIMLQRVRDETTKAAYTLATKSTSILSPVESRIGGIVSMNQSIIY